MKIRRLHPSAQPNEATQTRTVDQSSLSSPRSREQQPHTRKGSGGTQESNPLAAIGELNTNPQIITINSAADQDRFVYFLIPSYRLEYSEIKSNRTCNDAFFHRLRVEYYRRRGWIKSWFGLMVFSHCEFHKVR